MKQRHRNLDVVHHGLVLISDGRGKGRPSRLQLSKDQLAVQVPIAEGETTPAIADDASLSNAEIENQIRIVTIKKRKDGGGLGLSIKGGSEGSHNVPIVISKIFPKMPAEETGQLFVGDAIVEVNGEPVEGRSHDEVVEILKNAKEEVTIGVRHYQHITPYLKPAQSLQPSKDGSEKLYEPNTWKSAMKAQSELAVHDSGTHSASNLSEDKFPTGDEHWRTVTRIPLPMAYVTRYLFATDNLRPNAFEVRAVDGTSTGIVHCSDRRALDLWLRHIHNHIEALNQKSIKMSNKYLHPSEQISYIGWVAEQQPVEYSEDPKQLWQPRFLILKGGDVCLFDSPPDLNKCIYLYKVYDVAIRFVSKETRKKDKRQYCLWLESCIGGAGGGANRHYLSFESQQLLDNFEAAYHRCLHTSVTTMQTRTFACSCEGRPCGLVLDIKQGISLYDIPTKSYTWQYRFHDLSSSSDDGKMHVQLLFKDDRSLNSSKIEAKDIECDEVLTVVFSLHSFFVAKILAADPDFLKQNPLV